MLLLDGGEKFLKGVIMLHGVLQIVITFLGLIYTLGCVYLWDRIIETLGFYFWLSVETMSKPSDMNKDELKKRWNPLLNTDHEVRLYRIPEY